MRTVRELGHLLVIGGALRSNHAAVYRRFIDLAEGVERARIGIFPTASASLASSQRMMDDLVRYGVPPEHIYIADLTRTDLISQIERSTGFYFVGGDQLRITEALLTAEGRDTPVMAAIRRVYATGGVIAGSSAGAAMQSERMMSASGVPLDTLDGGLATQPYRRGVYVSPGLRLFKGGIIDQHFNTYDGRPARLARVLVETGVPLGFGVDENTAMAVCGEESFEVIGTGAVTILDASRATWEEGPLGVRVSGVEVTLLQEGDRYDLRTGEIRVHEQKTLIRQGEEYRKGNRVITDLTQTNAFHRAMTVGLIDNTAQTQIGWMLRQSGQQNQARQDTQDTQGQQGQPPRFGYKFTFSKTDSTAGYFGTVNGVDSYAAVRVRMDVEPLTVHDLLGLSW